MVVLYGSLIDAPNYKTNFKQRQPPSTSYNEITNPDLRKFLGDGEWYKVYDDGWIGAGKWSLHYCMRKVNVAYFDVEYHKKWSNSA